MAIMTLNQRLSEVMSTFLSRFKSLSHAYRLLDNKTILGGASLIQP